MSKKTVLVTGGCGYIGSHVTRQLTEAGYSVEAIAALLAIVGASGCGPPAQVFDRVPEPVRPAWIASRMTASRSAAPACERSASRSTCPTTERSVVWASFEVANR